MKQPKPDRLVEMLGIPITVHSAETVSIISHQQANDKFITRQKTYMVAHKMWYMTKDVLH